jgi:hypothetical protein
MQFVNIIADIFGVIAWITLFAAIFASMLAFGAYIVCKVIDVIKEVASGGK